MNGIANILLLAAILLVAIVSMVAAQNSEEPSTEGGSTDHPSWATKCTKWDCPGGAWTGQDKWV